MSEKRFRVRFEQEDGKGEIVNEKGVELTAREVVDLLNEQQATINRMKHSLNTIYKSFEKMAGNTFIRVYSDKIIFTNIDEDYSITTKNYYYWLYYYDCE